MRRALPSLWRTARQRRVPVFPFVVLAVLLVAGAAAPFVAPHDPLQQDLRAALRPPFFQEGGSLTHVLGTDRLGRDMLSRLIFGARVSLVLATAVIVIGGTLGTVLGLISGYASGRTDAVIQRGVESVLSLPTLLVALVFVFVVGQSFFTVVVVLAPFIAARFARMVRGDVLQVRELDYVALARVAGASHLRIIARHILPNITGTIIVITTLEVGSLILVEASLSFLGVGVPPPTPAWGLMVADGRVSTASAYWLSLFPGLAIVAVVISTNWLGDWLRDFLDPRGQVI